MFRSRKNIVHTCNTEHSLQALISMVCIMESAGTTASQAGEPIARRTGSSCVRDSREGDPCLVSAPRERWPTPTCCDECSKKQTTGIPTNPSVPQQTSATPSHWPAGRSPPKQFHVGRLPNFLVFYQTAFISFSRDFSRDCQLLFHGVRASISNSTSHGAAFATPAGDKSLRWLNVTHIGRPRCKFAASHRAPTVALNFKSCGGLCCLWPLANTPRQQYHKPRQHSAKPDPTPPWTVVYPC